MSVLRALTRHIARLVPLLFLLAGCGETSRSVIPLRETHWAKDVAGKPSENNLPPITTILSPSPSDVLTPLLTPPVTIQWRGEDPRGHIREYRYRLFYRRNPDFPLVADFVEFLNSNPDSVLRYYAPDFAGWDRVEAKKDLETASVTYADLISNQVFAFAVVSIDNRGACDPNLSRNRNLLMFAVPAPPPPDLTFSGPFGQVTNPTDPVVVPAGQPVTIKWFATPRPGQFIEGYISSTNEGGPLGEPSLGDTIATVPPPASGNIRLLFVEVSYQQDQTSFRSLRYLQLLFTGGSVVMRQRE